MMNAEPRYYCVAGLTFRICLDAPRRFMRYSEAVTERIRRGLAGEVTDAVPIRAGDPVPSRSLIKDRSELSSDLNSGDLDFSQYEPFLARPTDDVIYSLTVKSKEPLWLMTLKQDAGQPEFSDRTSEPFFDIYRYDGNTVYIFLSEDEKPLAKLVVSEDARTADYYPAATLRPLSVMTFLNLSNMIMFSYGAAAHSAILIHASTVSLDGAAYMFLGPSGTGKSTHARLWLENIEGARLINDDNPAIRMEKGQPFVYGTPWSGKTPCYRNVRFPIKAIVRLTQAPHNAATPVAGLNAYADIVSSVTSIKWERAVMDGITSTVSEIAMSGVKCLHLDCLPNAAAALTCKDAASE